MRVLVAGLGDVGGRAAATSPSRATTSWACDARRLPDPTGSRWCRATSPIATSPTAANAPFDRVLVTVSADGRDPELYRSAYVEGPTTVLAGLARRGDPVARVVFTSSSAVYGQRDGEWVDEASPTDPSSATGAVSSSRRSESIADAGSPPRACG